MDWSKEWKPLAWTAAAFLACFILPAGWPRFDNAVGEALHLVRWYAREHVLLCLVPAFFIAGAIGVFVGKASVMRYLGPGANKVLAYGVASVSGSVLAVCSCTVLPLFAGIWRMGAGLGPACAFLYSGPAINVLAIILTARVLGLEIGIARAVGAIVFSVVIGLLMHLIYRKEETEKANNQMAMPEPEVSRPLWKNALYFATMVGILVFANWGKPIETTVPAGGPRVAYQCPDGVLRIFTGDESVSPYHERRNPLYCWEVNPKDFSASNRQVIMDGPERGLRFSNVPSRFGKGMNIGFARLSPLLGNRQILTYRLMTRNFKPATEAELDQCGTYYSEIIYDGDVKEQWEFEK